MLFKNKPARLGHPLHMEMLNEQGACVLKIRCCICCTLISYHNNSWICLATHILSHDIATLQNIVAATAFAFECEANGEPFPIHKLPTPLIVKKEPANDGALMQRTFAAPSYGTDTLPYHQIKRTIAKWIAAHSLLYRIVETCAFKWMTRRSDLKCPDFRRKAINY